LSLERLQILIKAYSKSGSKTQNLPALVDLSV